MFEHPTTNDLVCGKCGAVPVMHEDRMSQRIECHCPKCKNGGMSVRVDPFSMHAQVHLPLGDQAFGMKTKALVAMVWRFISGIERKSGPVSSHIPAAKRSERQAAAAFPVMSVFMDDPDAPELQAELPRCWPWLPPLVHFYRAPSLEE